MPEFNPVLSGHNYSRICACLISALFATILYADQANAQRQVITEAGATLRIYTTEDGIPSNTPNNAIITEDGFLWLSTSGGTVRISGNEIEDFGADIGISMMRFAYYDRSRDRLWFTDNESLIQFDGQNITRYDTEDGFIPPGSARKDVFAIHADQDDALWIGSYSAPLDAPRNGGLIKLRDGEFKTITFEELPLHNIIRIYSQSDGTLWFTSIGYQGEGYFANESFTGRYFDGNFEVFDGDNDCHNVYTTFRAPDGISAAIYEDIRGDLWFQCSGKINTGNLDRANHGLFRFDGESFHSVDEINQRLIEDFQVSEIFYDDDSDELYVTINKQMGISPDDVSRSIFVLKNGEWQQEIIQPADQLLEYASAVIDKEAVIFAGVYMLKGNAGQLLANFQILDRNTNAFYSTIFEKGESGWQWVDTIPGFIIMNLQENVYLTAHNEPDVIGVYTPPYSRLMSHEEGLLKSPAQGSRFFMDQENNVWLTYADNRENENGTYDAEGLSVWDGNEFTHLTVEDGLSSNRVYYPFQSSDGSIWIPSLNSVNRVMKSGDRYSVTPVYGPDGAEFHTRAVTEGPDGELFAYMDYVSPATDQTQEYNPYFARFNGQYFEPFDNPFPDNLTSHAYHSYELLHGRDNRLWLVARFADDDSGSLFVAPSHIRSLENGEWIEPPEQWEVPNSRLFYVGELEGGRYFVREGGFYKFDYEQDRFIDLSDSTNIHADYRILRRVNTYNMLFQIEGAEHLYIRFRDMGIAIYDGLNLSYFDRRDGLSTLRLTYPNPAPNGDVLFATPTGGVIFSGKNFTSIRDESVMDGNSIAIARDKHDRIMLLYQGMGVSFIERDTTRYPVRIASIRADTLDFYPGQNPRLKASQNQLVFRFATLNFTNPDDVRYTYKLNGFDSEWSNHSRVNRAEYRNLPAGQYTFRLLAISPGNIASDEASFTFSIAPPWWRSWWAYAMYALLFISVVIAIDRLQRRRLMKREREKARERELEQAREIEKAYKNLEVAHENLKSAQEQLVQQEKLASLGQLTAGIAHEIKNPLNFVNNFSEVSLELVEEMRHEIIDLRQEKKESLRQPAEGSDPSVDGEQGDDSISEKDESPTLILEILDDIEANLRKIHEHGSRADSIVRSMLQHSRGGSGKMEPTNLNALIKEYVNLSFHGMRAGKEPINVDIDLQLDDSIGEVPLIAEDFSRVILNLCNNSFDAMREKEKSLRQPAESAAAERRRGVSTPGEKDNSKDLQGFENLGGLKPYTPKLTVRTKPENGKVTIEIEDNGPGIPNEMKHKILQPFFTTKKGTEGTGLGLSITNDIVKAHGGTLEINSSNGETIFSIALQNSS